MRFTEGHVADDQQRLRTPETLLLIHLTRDEIEFFLAPTEEKFYELDAAARSELIDYAGGRR